MNDIEKEIERLEIDTNRLCYYKNEYMHYIGCVYLDNTENNKIILDNCIYIESSNDKLNESQFFMLIKKWFLSYNNSILYIDNYLYNKNKKIYIPNNSNIYSLYKHDINFTVYNNSIKIFILDKYSIISKLLESIIKSKKEAFIKLRLEIENNYFENIISDFLYKSTLSNL